MRALEPALVDPMERMELEMEHDVEAKLKQMEVEMEGRLLSK